jgi:uncharacterized membrane protein YeiH
MQLGFAPVTTQIITAVSVIVIRVIAARYHIALPTLKGDHTDGADMDMHSTKE